MRFSNIVVVYFIMGAVVVGAGVVPASHLGIAIVFVDVQGDSVSADGDSIGGQEGTSGMLDNLIGPIKNALNTITGGALLAVWGPVSKMAGFYAWPLVTVSYLGAPTIVKLLSGSLVASFTMGVLRVFRASI